MTLTGYHPFDCIRQALWTCARETAAFKKQVRTGKPLGYTWPLWHQKRSPRFVPETVAEVLARHCHIPAWYRQPHGAAWTKLARANVAAGLGSPRHTKPRKAA